MNVSLVSISFLISILLQYTIQKVFLHYNKFDDFNHRSSHKTLATRTGGIGIFSTLLLVSLFYYFQGIELFDYSLFIPLGIMFMVGVYDDFYNADFKLKFFLQIIVAKILIDQGYVISNYYGLFGLYEVPWFVAQITTIIVFIVVVNAINFIDGIDGLAVTEVIKTIFIIEFFSNSFTQISTFGFLIIGALFPLYYFNFKKNNKVFLGDSGSLFLGTFVMIYLLYVLDSRHNLNLSINKTIFSVLVIVYPLIDLLRVFIIRIMSGKSPFVADQNHLHHILLRKFKYMIVVDIIILLFSITTLTIFIL